MNNPIIKKISADILSFWILTSFFGAFFIAPGFSSAESDIIPCSGTDCTICSVFQLIANIINFAAFKIAAPLGGLILAYGGIMIVTAGANESNAEKGKSAVRAAIIGLVITFAAWVIVNTVLGALADNDWKNSWYQFQGCD